jgi:hypothetical protein
VIKVLELIKSVWKLAVVGIAAFVILAAVGVFIALDTASNPSAADATTVSVDASQPANKPTTPSDPNGLNAPGSPVVESLKEVTDEGADNAGSMQPQPIGQAPANTSQDSNASTGNPSSLTPNTGDGTNANAGNTNAPSLSTPQKTWHEPVYATIHHDAVYQSIHHDTEYITQTKYYSVCSQCGYKVQGSIYPHQDATGHTGFASDVPVSEQVLVRAAFDEQVLVQAAYDEQVLVTAGYWS